MTHVGQCQEWGGTRYWAMAIAAHAQWLGFRNPYRYEVGQPWTSYNMEQQGSISATCFLAPASAACSTPGFPYRF